MQKSFFNRFKNKYAIGALIILLILVAFSISKNRNKPATFEYTLATIGTVKQTVSVTGTVLPVGQASLAFEKSGVIAQIYVRVGDIVRRGDALASLSSANDKAALDSAKSMLADTSRALTQEELAVQKTAILNAENDALNSAHSGFVKAQGAIFNYSDLFFNNPQSANPSISISTQSIQTQMSINNKRVLISDELRVWADELSGGAVEPATKLILKSQKHLLVIKNFLNDLSVIVSALSVGNSGLSQTEINADIEAMNLALTTLDSAISSVTSAQTTLRTVESNYNLKLAGNSQESIAIQTAKVAQAQAELDKDTLRSPIDGVVTLVDPNIGEFVSAGKSSFGVQSDSSYKIEANVPEADIAKVAVRNTGTATLDAYGSNMFFDVNVGTIDPAPIVIEGVPTYKVTMFFSKSDTRIRSGMTANLEILTNQRPNVLEVPYRALTITSTSTTVNLVNADGKTYTTIPIVAGLKGSDGTIEITSGLKEGDKVVTYIKK